MTAYSPEICIKICDLLSAGQSLTSICKRKDMPSITAVMNWLADPDKVQFLAQYTRARESMADTIAEEILDIADDETLPSDSRRIRVDVRKWYAGKVRPKKYGESTQIKHADADGNKLTCQGILNDINGGTTGIPGTEDETE